MRIVAGKIVSLTSPLTIFTTLLVLGLLATGAAGQNYTTTSTRTQNVQENCARFSRSLLVTEDTRHSIDGLKGYLNSYFGFTSNNFIKSLLRGNSTQIGQQFSNYQNGATIVFYIPFLAGLLVLLLIWPFLLCCCLCRCCCCGCCRPNQKGYTRSQLNWPSMVLFLLLLIVIAASVLGMVRLAGSVTNSADKIRCSSSIFVDDIINGNVTEDQNNYFAGIQTFNDQLGTLQNSIQALVNNLSSIRTSGLSTLRNQLSTARTDVSNIPNGAGGALTLQYPTPFNSGSPSSSIASVFPTILGVSTQPGTLVGNTTIVLNAVSEIITSVGTTADFFVDNANNVNSSIAGFRTNLTQTTNSLAALDNDFDQNVFVEYVEPLSHGFVLGLFIFYGVLILISLLMIIGLGCMRICSMEKCRYLLYFLCTFLFFLAILAFLLAILMTVVVPFSLMGCNYTSYALTNQTTFRESFTGIINQTDIDLIVTCLPTSSGNILEQITGAEIIQQLQSLSDNVNNLTQFQNLDPASYIRNSFDQITIGLNSARNTAYIDFNDSSNLQILEKLSSASNYGCTANGFTSDSWVPSNSQTTVTCKTNGGVSSNSSTCPTTSNFDSQATGCNGCMDSTSFERLFNTNAAGIQTRFQNRYPGANCQSFATEISNTWANYLTTKRTALVPVQTRRSSTGNGSITTVADNINNNILPTFTSIRIAVQNLSSRVTDPQTGLVAGFNCRVVGEDVVRLSELACVQVLPFAYILLIVSGIIGFGLLVALCCIVCVGVRHSVGRFQQNGSENAKRTEKEANQQRPYFVNNGAETSQDFNQYNTHRLY